MLFSTETWVFGLAGVLWVGGVITLLSGGLALRRARQRKLYFQVRRKAILQAWQSLMLGAGLLIASGLVGGFGQRGVEVIFPPTVTPTPSNTPTPSPTATLSPTITLTPSQTLPPSATLPPSITPTVTLTPTPTAPALPIALITPPGAVIVTPPANAVSANLRVGRFNTCRSNGGVSEFFTPAPKTLYALFDYNNWLPGSQWTNVWLYNGAIVEVETLLWDGSTGGCGYADFDNRAQPWPEGAYEVQIFLGEIWMGSAPFFISARTPTPASP